MNLLVQTGGVMSHVTNASHGDLPAATDWKAGALAGLIAGIVFLMLEMGLVWMVQGMSPWGPPYMMSAMVLGADVLPAMGTWAVFDLKIVMIAMMIHFPMSVALGLLGAWLVHRFALAVAVMVGAGLGLVVYLINFYLVAPMAFPWFEMGRNWIGAFAHIMFGAVIAISYMMLRKSGAADRDTSSSGS
ncbi:MAG: hypothetical protein RQ826_03000 [Xanthomonadales bacterium]|nr:hypothetical protein [Xanthomonadales bacterium]